MLDTAIQAARNAGKILEHFFGNLDTIEVKDNQQFNLVTQADKDAERSIIETIHRRFPGHDILGEEGGSQDLGSEYKWIIDPLDGTTNFTHAFPIFSVSIALEYRGELIAGVVYDPSRDEMFTAEKGAGAYLNGERIWVSETSDIERAMLVTGFPYNIRENPNYCFERFIGFLGNVQAVRRLGSAALDCAYVAAGRLDGFWEISLQPWDKAAGDLLVREAGGRVSDFEGRPHDIYKLPFLGSNGFIHEEMIGILESSKKLTVSMPTPLHKEKHT